MLRRKLTVLWLRYRIHSRNVTLADLKDLQKGVSKKNEQINLYMLELRDRNCIDHARIATLNYLGAQHAKSQ